jgi:superfamily I DNA/RNA helicase/RecB family exonuclease
VTSPELRRPAREAPLPPQLDAAQQAVAGHRGGPLLVLAGPGTGKTTTLVEAVGRRVDAGASPERILTLTFSRRAALELRQRIGLRLARTTGAPLAWTFHAFCLALLRQQRDSTDPGGPLRLLTGPQQELAVRDLLAGDAAEGTGAWPPVLRRGLGTRGLAREVRALLARARELGLAPEDLAGLARAAGRDDWLAAAAFFETYLDVLDAQASLDYSELVYRAALLVERPEVREQWRGRLDAVFVDEYQDTDPAQERLLTALAGGGRDLVVFGDPDQAIYAFRGADVTGLLRFPERFRTATLAPAPVLSLRTCRRSGPDLLAVSRRVATRLPAPGLPVAALLTHRDLRAVADAPAGEVEVALYASASAEAKGIADRLRREHLHEGVPWERMAVLVRSAVRSLPLLRRVLGASGVPVEAAGDELPLAEEPAVAPLLLALRVADDPGLLDADTTHSLLTSPLVGADPADLRRLGRALRAAERARRADTGPGELPPPAAELLRRAVVEPDLPPAGPESRRSPVRTLADLLTAARGALAAGAGPEGALWAVWSGSTWPSALEAAALAGGPDGEAADRDLDAVLALFDAARRHALTRPRAGAGPFTAELAAQHIPADPLAEREVARSAVRLLTAHRSKGLEWDVVVVCGVQEGTWPDLRARGTLLTPDRLGPDGIADPPGRASLLADERRLFYVALTRARRRLLVTAVVAADGDGERPSRFLDELGLDLPAGPQPDADPMTLPGLVARLRRAAVDPGAHPDLRAAAARRLAHLAAARDPGGVPVVPAADPRTWWGIDPLTDPGETPYHAETPLRLSGTSLTEFENCPLRWLLRHELHADTATSPALGIGTLLHALAEGVADGTYPEDPQLLMAEVDRVWSHLDFDAPWVGEQQRSSVREGLDRFVAWLRSPGRRELLGAEVPFTLDLDLPSGTVALRGRADRLELRADSGEVVVVDIKTGTATAPTKRQVEEHLQLAIYQLAVSRGAFEGIGLRTPGGAELLQLRLKDRTTVLAQSQPAPAPAAPGELTGIEVVLDQAAGAIRAEHFPPRPGEGCRTCGFTRCCPAQAEGRPVVA